MIVRIYMCIIVVLETYHWGALYKWKVPCWRATTPGKLWNLLQIT